MKLSPVFSDGMVLQRDAWNTIKGTATSGNLIVMKVKDVRIEGRTDEEGRFSLALPALPAESGITFSFEEFSEEEGSVVDAVEIKDAAFGDVFLLSGQSNMELPVVRTLDVTEGVIASSDYPLIREFVVPMEYDFDAPRRDLTGGEWKHAGGKEIYQFGATGFFMARALYEKYQVPIGLVRAAIGGTPIQAWCSEKTVTELGDFTEEVKQCRRKGYIEEIQKREEREQREWYEQAGQFAEPLGARGELVVPGLWKDTELAAFHGSLIIEKEFFLQEAAGSTARAYLGAIVDADKVYI
ncbi:MAG: sialate O-acetylesterase, partial [Lachnospiraceae bacterium]